MAEFVVYWISSKFQVADDNVMRYSVMAKDIFLISAFYSY